MHRMGELRIAITREEYSWWGRTYFTGVCHTKSVSAGFCVIHLMKGVYKQGHNTAVILAAQRLYLERLNARRS